MQRISFFIVRFLTFCFFICCGTHGLDIVFNLPAKLTINKEHSVILTVFHANIAERLTVSIDVRNQANNRKVFAAQTTFTTSAPVHTYRLPVQSDSLPYEWTFPEPGTDVMCLNTIEVSVVSSNGPAWSHEKLVPVMKKRGHIFIQTDRPVYRPGDEVFVRFIPVDEAMLPFDSPMSMSILAPNPKVGGDPLTSWTKKKAAINSVFSRKFRLPETPPLGQWIVKANFFSQDIVHDEFVSSFYVQEFTLPTFELAIEATREDFILPGDESFSVDIRANFIYGEAVEGTVNIRFGLYTPDLEHMMHSTHIIPRRHMSRGLLTVNVPIGNLTGGSSIASLIEARTHLFIEASVTEQGGGKTRSLRNGDIMFTSSPLVLDLERTPKYYKPGLPFSVRVVGFYANAVAARDVDVTVTVVARRADGRTSQVFNETLPTCAEGTLLARFIAPTNTNSMTVTVHGQFVSSRNRVFPASAQKEIRPQVSSYGEHLQIVVPRKDFAMDVMASVEIYVTSTPIPKTVVYTITSGRNYLREGKAEVESNSDHVMITFPVVSEMSPTSHMTAYYVTQSVSGVSFIVADSAILNVEEACQGTELDANVVIAGNTVPYAGDRVDVAITGDPSSFVGLTGVDASALSLQSEFSDQFGKSAQTTRSNIFDIVRSFSPGCKVPSIPFSESAFPAVGRALVTSVSHNFLEASSARCDDAQETILLNERNRRSVHLSTLGMMDKADHIFGLAYECCAIGSDDVSSVMTYTGDACEQRAATIQLGRKCKEAFLECCREAECIRNNPTRTTRPCIPSYQQVRTVSMRTYAPVTGATVLGRSVHLLRKNFAHTWFNADFRLGERGRIVLSDSSNPRIPKLPDSITSWSIRAFSISPGRGMCIAEPATFAVEHSLFIEVVVPQAPVIRGTRVPIDVILFSYLPTRVKASVILEAEENLCAGVQPGLDSEPTVQYLPPSRNGVSSSAVVRFTVIPIVAGEYNVKVKMSGYYNNNDLPRIDKVIKTLQVIPEGEPHRQVQWLLIDKRHDQRSRRPTNAANTATIQALNMSLPTNAIPGSEEAAVTIHSITTAFLREPLMIESDGSTTTIAQYLYQLQAIISKIETSASTPSEAYLAELAGKAQTAYDGLLAYARDMRPASRDSIASNTEPFYGFSYSPAEISKPDLWLTCATLRTICRAAELVELEPDRNILWGSLRWILSHQAPRRSGYFTNSADLSFSRKKRSLCSTLRKRSSKRDTCSKRKKRHSTHRQFKQWQKKCRQRRRRCRRRRNAVRQLQKLPHFTSNLDRKIYRTAVIASFLSSVLDSTNPMKTTTRRPLSFGAINNHKLRSSLRWAAKYIGIQTRKTRHRNASPITLAAASRAIYMLLGRVDRRNVESVERYKIDEGDLGWIKTDDGSRTLTPSQALQVQSANVEATAYFLHLNILKGEPDDKLAYWLLKQRGENGRWVSLRDTLAAMDALGSYVAQSLPSSSSVSSLRVELSAPGMTSPQSMTPSSGSSDIAQTNTMKLPVTNNAVTMTTTGTGKAWVEFDVRYNAIPTNNAATTFSSATAASSLCPYDVSVTMNSADLPTTFIILARKAVSDKLWKINLSVRFKSSYDPTESEDPTYVVDFGLHSDFEVITEDLEKLSNSIEKAVDHYRISERALLLYMSGERNVSFKLRNRPNIGNVLPIPVTVYPAAFPERRCTSFYSRSGSSENIGILCSSDSSNSRTSRDVCLCASGRSCPKIIGRSKSIEATTELRKNLTCHHATKFAYRVKFTSVTEMGAEWNSFQGRIRNVFRSSIELQSVAKDQTHTFWLKSPCPLDKIMVTKEYLVIGRSMVQGRDGLFKHLLDSFARVEQWPGKKNRCSRITNPQVNTICRKLSHYSYQMRRGGCPT